MENSFGLAALALIPVIFWAGRSATKPLSGDQDAAMDEDRPAAATKSQQRLSQYMDM
jgi:hypothetical protein